MLGGRKSLVERNPSLIIYQSRGAMPEQERKYISKEELLKHNKRGDLWISIHGKIYNVSNWTKDHPGGEIPLLNLAGQEVTDAFIAYHPHSASLYLDKFFTGFYLQDYSVSELSIEYRKLFAEISKLGMFEKKGHVTLSAFCLIALILLINFYGVLFSDSIWVHLGCGCLVGLLWIQSGFLSHDSAHYEMMPSRRFNHFSQIITANCLTGISIEWWKWNHNAHHIACNSLDFDPDLQHIPIFAVSSKLFHSLTSCFHKKKMDFNSVARFLVSFQHWTFYPVMGFARVNLFAQSILFLLSNRKIPRKGLEILGLVLFWIWYPLLISNLPNWGERVMFIVASLLVSGIQHIQFCLNHFASNVYVGPPTGNDWFEKQIMGTLNISCPPWMDWFHGGLQFQVEHHLFPRLPRYQLRKVSPVVKDLCKKHNLPYHCASFWKANVMVMKTLYNAALQARDFAIPEPKNLVWEAMNTHG